MAKSKMFSIYDSKVQVFGPVFFSQHAGQALRSFEELTNDGQSTISKYPTDFTLYELGEFDSSSGEFFLHDKHLNLGQAVSFKRQPAAVAPLFNQEKGV